MNTYTLTWRAGSSLYNRIRRCHFCRGSFYWVTSYDDAIQNFCRLVTNVFCEDFRCVRLIKCGKLVARAATYSGVA